MAIPVFSIIGWSGAGKTTFLEKLIALLKARGLRLAVIKEVPRPFQADTEGKDSYRFSKAGADRVVIANPQTVVQYFNRPMTVADIVATIDDADLILTEGHHHFGYPQLEIYRKAVNDGLRCPCIENLVGVITDDELPLQKNVRRFHFDEVEQVADFLLTYSPEET